MPPRQKLRSAYSGGWTPQKKAMVEAIVLPKKLRCSDCSKLINVSGFSEKQCKDLRHGIVNRQVNPAMLEEEAWLRCRKCTGTQPTEMACMVCDTVKVFEDFTKAQRRNPDRATCEQCMWDIQHTDPIEKTAADAEDDDSDSDGTSNAREDSEFDESEAGGAPLSAYELNTANLRSLDISNAGGSSKPSVPASMSSANVGRVSGAVNSTGLKSWQAMSNKNAGSAAASTPGAQFTGYDPTGRAHQRFQAPSSVASNESDESDETTTAELVYDAKAEKEARSKFAKLPGLGRQAPRPVDSSGRILPQQHDSDDDDDDDLPHPDYYTI